MSTTIQWTNERWNPVTGCEKVSQGCKNCYAEGIANRFWGARKFTDVICHEDRLEIPLHWRKPRKVFVNSMSDLFHEDVSESFIRAVFAVMAQCRQHTFQVLTKRPERMGKMLREWEAAGLLLREGHGAVLPNAQLGTSIEDQPTANERIALLAKTPAAVRWLSIEPQIAEISLRWLPVFHENAPYRAVKSTGSTDELDGLRRLDWVVCGGESGPKARPFDLRWAYLLKEQCEQAGVPFFMKQMGSNPVFDGKPLKFRDSHGGEPGEWPEDLRIRQYPLELAAEL